MSNLIKRSNTTHHHSFQNAIALFAIALFIQILFSSIIYSQGSITSNSSLTKANKQDSIYWGKKGEQKQTIEYTPYFAPNPFANVLRGKFYTNYYFHMRDKETNNGYGPYQNSYTVEHPSVAAFFDDNGGFGGDLVYSFNTSFTGYANLVIGAGYDYHELTSNYPNTKIVLGNNLSIKAITIHLGVDFPLFNDPENSKIWCSGTIAPTIKYYEGTYSDSGFSFVNNYSGNLGVRFTGELLFYDLFSSSLFLSLSAGLEVASVDRGVIDVYHDGEKIDSEMIPGERTLQDNNIMIGVGIGYAFKF